MTTTKQTQETMRIIRNAGAQLTRCESRWKRVIASFEEELKQLKRAHAKRDPGCVEDVVAWHIQEHMITWLTVHIDMMKTGAYDDKEVKKNG